MIVFVGLMIGVMVVALYLPIFPPMTSSDDRVGGATLGEGSHSRRWRLPCPFSS